tara:strand:+ start:173 stop:571 length:399 start_codon:yes stop_codon:yes gene_type:complete
MLFAGEMEVDGDLKVNGQIDASNQRVKNVGPPTDMRDAINAQTLQDALRNDGFYEYDYIRVKFNNGMYSGTGSTFSTSYMELGQESWTSDFVSKLNQLMLQGWNVSHRFDFGDPMSSETYIVIYELRKPIDE